MPALSAGLLVYRLTDGVLEVLLVHPGGPFWVHRDDGTWSVPKGEVEGTDDLAGTAAREFAEELGVGPPVGPHIDLGQVTQRGGKRVHVWGVVGDVDVTATRSNTFDVEWPPGSGQIRSFPEIDRAAWFTAPVARRKLVAAQSVFVDRLALALATSDGPVGADSAVGGDGAPPRPEG